MQWVWQAEKLLACQKGIVCMEFKVHFYVVMLRCAANNYLFVLYTGASSRKTQCCCTAIWLIKGWKLECRGGSILLGLTVIYILRIEVFVEMKVWHLVVCPVVHTSIFGTCCHHLQDRIWTKLGQDKKDDQVRERTGGVACLETEMGP